jgi:3-methyladenine DNA glycosylase AlkD
MVVSRASRLGPMFALFETRKPKLQRTAIELIKTELASELRASDVAAFGTLLECGIISDLRVIDKLALDVLGALLERAAGRAEIVRELAGWRTSASMGQRRAACVAFTVIAPQGDHALDGFVDVALTLCSACVWSIEPLDQTAVGWLLRELSRPEPSRVEAFVRRHARFMSRDCIREAIDQLSADRKRALLDGWKRARTPRSRD